MTARSDDDGGGPYGDASHDHDTAEEAESCERCDEFTARISGFPTKREMAEARECRERDEYARLRAKFE